MVKKLLILGLAFVLFGPACVLLSIGVLMNPAIAGAMMRLPCHREESRATALTMALLSTRWG